MVIAPKGNPIIGGWCVEKVTSFKVRNINSMRERIRDEEADLPAEVYVGDSYFEWDQLSSMCQQLIEIRRLNPKSVLEIGMGNGFVSSFLRRSGVKVTTVDVNEALEPDFVGSVTDLDSMFEENSFDCVLCAEVLEHIPFSEFESCLDMIFKVAKDSVLITIPRLQYRPFDFQARIRFLPFTKHKEIGFCIPVRLPKSKMYSGHHWEVDSCKETKLRALKKHFSKRFAEFKTYQYRWKSYHVFFSGFVRPKD